MARVTIIVLDSFGVGALPDAADYGDAGASTLGHIKEHMGRLDIPHMVELGLYSIDGLGLGAEAHLNTPGKMGGNWAWRAAAGFETKTLAKTIADECSVYCRV